MKKVGIIGAKPFTLGSQDFEAPCRIDIRKALDTIFTEVIGSQDIVVSGITGLNIGIEQDFALSCLENRINYIVYLPFADQKKLWIDYPNTFQNKYEDLLDKADHVNTINKGDFSPRKILLQNKKLISDSDIIIYHTDIFDSFYNTNIELINKLEKEVIFLGDYL